MTEREAYASQNIAAARKPKKVAFASDSPHPSKNQNVASVFVVLHLEATSTASMFSQIFFLNELISSDEDRAESA